MARIIMLKNGGETILDDEDFDKFGIMEWERRTNKRHEYAAQRIYVSRTAGKQIYRNVYLHREIIDCPPHAFVDHINGDGLDNRRINIRVCSQTENMRNRRKFADATSKFKGVSSYGVRRFRAYIYVDKKQINLGTFPSEVEAALAYDRAAKQMFGEFARLNFPQSPARRDDAEFLAAASVHSWQGSESEIANARFSVPQMGFSVPKEG